MCGFVGDTLCNVTVTVSPTLKVNAGPGEDMVLELVPKPYCEELTSPAYNVTLTVPEVDDGEGVALVDGEGEALDDGEGLGLVEG